MGSNKILTVALVSLIIIFNFSLILYSEEMISSTHIDTDLARFDESASDKDEIRKTDWAFSPIWTQDLARFEMDIAKSTFDYLIALKAQLNKVERWIKDYEASTNHQSDLISTGLGTWDEQWAAAELLAEHPIMSYRMIRRFAKDLTNVGIEIEPMAFPAETQFVQAINEFNKSFSFPTAGDVVDVTHNILRLQDVYDLTPHDLMNGKVGSRQGSFSLNMHEAFEIGKNALDAKFYTGAWSWFQTIWDKLRENENVLKSQVHDKMRQLVEEHDTLRDSVTDENYYTLNMNRFRSKIVSEDHKLETEKEAQIQWFRKSRSMLDSTSFMVLCDGDNFLNESEKSKLYCFYERKLNPFWTINPLKIEVYSIDPYVIQIYQVVQEKLINNLKNAAIPHLVRSEVFSNENHSYVSNERTSSQTFIHREHYPPARELEKLIGSMTGLQVENSGYGVDNDHTMIASEELQIASYTFGTHYAQHYDCLLGKMNETSSGDRIATFMIYLNDVELGGYTAFPRLGIAIPPVKGSAVFWYDMMRNGIVDERSLHGGCPVIIGQKWIANKWIRYNANFRKRPCSLNPEE